MAKTSQHPNQDDEMGRLQELGLIGKEVPIFLEEEDCSGFSLNSNFMAFIVFTAFLMGVIYFLSYDLLTTPQEVVQARQKFEEVRSNYLANQEEWDQKKDVLKHVLYQHRKDPSIYKSFLELEDIPLEICYSFLHDELGFDLQKTPDFALFPVLFKEGGEKFILTKQESYWLFPVDTSLEMLFSTSEGKLGVQFLSLKKGVREYPISSAVKVFDEEFQFLRPLTGYLSGAQSVGVFQTEENAEKSSISSVRMRLTYQQRTIL